jgi:hypothetical protein
MSLKIVRIYAYSNLNTEPERALNSGNISGTIEPLP